MSYSSTSRESPRSGKTNEDPRVAGKKNLPAGRRKRKEKEGPKAPP